MVWVLPGLDVMMPRRDWHPHGAVVGLSRQLLEEVAGEDFRALASHPGPGSAEQTADDDHNRPTHPAPDRTFVDFLLSFPAWFRPEHYLSRGPVSGPCTRSDFGRRSRKEAVTLLRADSGTDTTASHRASAGLPGDHSVSGLSPDGGEGPDDTVVLGLPELGVLDFQDVDHSGEGGEAFLQLSVFQP